MSPEEKEQFNEMLEELKEIKAWIDARKKQQLEYPLDTVSADIITNI